MANFTLPSVEGLTVLDTPRVNGGGAGNRFALPPGFDEKKFASRWALDGPEVQEAQQPEVLAYANAKAQGWSVWHPEKTKDVCTRVVGKHKYILMFRPIALQEAVTLCYAAESRGRVNLELKGETNHANDGGDAGILSAADLKRYGKLNGDDTEELLPPVLMGKNPRDASTINLE